MGITMVVVAVVVGIIVDVAVGLSGAVNLVAFNLEYVDGPYGILAP